MINYLENRGGKNISITLDGERRGVTAIRKGSINEHIAKAWLLKQGYEVFANISPEGPADLVAVNFQEGVTIYVDVKSQSFTMDGSDGEVFRTRARQYGIRYLVVDDDGSCRWIAPVSSNDNVNMSGRTSITATQFRWVDPATIPLRNDAHPLRLGAAECILHEGEYSPIRQSRRWAGYVIMEVLGLDKRSDDDNRKAHKILLSMLADGRLTTTTCKDPLTRKQRQIVRVARWLKPEPKTEVAA